MPPRGQVIVMMIIQDVVLHDFRDFVFDLGKRREVLVRGET